MQPRTKWIVTVFIGLLLVLLVGVAGRLHDTADPSPVKEIPAYRRGRHAALRRVDPWLNSMFDVFLTA